MAEQRKPNRGPSAGPENRRALLAAAREVFAESGYRAPLSAIAQRAGVGQGSLYRHFPDRMSLAVAVFDENIEDLERIVAAPNATFDDLVVAVTEQAVASTAIIDVILAHRGDPRAAHLNDRLRTVAATLLDHELAARRIDPAVTADDVMLALAMLAGEIARSVPEQRADIAARGRRILDRAFETRESRPAVAG